jgi:phosphatidylserine decarboxylase precursor
VYSVSEVEGFHNLIMVKGITYSLTEFLFGKDFQHSELEKIIINPNKKMYQMTIYLSPGDCHRYYSASDQHVGLRIYVPGFLEPVKPSYINSHKKAFLTNERVTLVGNLDKSDDYLFTTFVGALNVGSVNLSFDDFLKTNQKLLKENLANPGYFLIKYANIMNQNLHEIEKKTKYYYKPAISLFNKEIQNEFSEFDVRDMIDIDADLIKELKINLVKINGPFANFKIKLLFDSIIAKSENMTYSINNNFLTYNVEQFKLRKKFKNAKELSIENFSLSNLGIHFRKKDELGWFNFGSTVVLIFTIDENQNIKFNFKEGEKVKIGQSLYSLQ